MSTVFNILLATVIAFLIVMLFASLKVSSDTNNEKTAKRDDPVSVTLERKVKTIQTYFFDDKNKLDFKKFCDYVLCIRNDEHSSKYLDYLAEFELLLICCNELQQTLLNLLLEEKSIILLSGLEKDFKDMQEYIRKGLFKGTYGDFCYIFFTTVFYLKSKM